MADVTGPISTLPGSKHSVPKGQACDVCGKPAVIRIQGETDSMGCEMSDYCLACGVKAERYSALSGQCDWCHVEAEVLLPIRDYEEGMRGPVYYVCQSCKRRKRTQI